MKLIKYKTKFTSKKDGKEYEFYQTAIQLDNGATVPVKAVFDDDKKLLLKLSEKVD